MENKPLVSVVVPSYNYERYIYDAVYSIYNQSYVDVELIIIDDCSKDGSVKIIESIIHGDDFRKRFDNNITFIKHALNKGAHYSINEGIMSASGLFVTILNADDLFESNRLEVMVKELLDKNAEIAFSKINVIDNEGKDISDDREDAKSFMDIQNNMYSSPTVGWSLIPQNVAISTGNMLFSKTLFQKVGGFRDLKYCHDWDFILRSVLVTEPLYIESTSYSYRLHGDNTFLKLNDVVDLEVKTVFGYYFLKCRRKTLNKLAPSPLNWGTEFKELIDRYSLGKFWLYSKLPQNYYLQMKLNLKQRLTAITNKSGGNGYKGIKA